MSFTKCVKGSDTSCQTTDKTQCCFYFEITGVPDSYTSSQDTFKALYNLVSYPQKVGDSGYFCQPKSTYDVYAEQSDFTWTDPLTGDTTKGFCAGATALKAFGALASLAIMTAY